jgi:hypothetical protein
MDAWNYVKVSFHRHKPAMVGTDRGGCNCNRISSAFFELRTVLILYLPVEVMHLTVRHARHRVIRTEFGDG